MLKLTSAVALPLVGALTVALLGAVAAQPGRAQALTPDASAFQRGPWGELGELEEGVTLSISQARYRDGAVLTFALRTDYAAGDPNEDRGSTIAVIELDCAAARFRRLSASASKRNGEMTESNAPGAFEAVPEGSVMAQLAGALCEGVSGTPGT